jgi:hypothetical protein
VVVLEFPGGFRERLKKDWNAFDQFILAPTGGAAEGVG